MNLLLDRVARHKAGEDVGIYSVCSAHPMVIEGTLRHALRRDAPFVLIEATSNQVNQDGGYTGMKPAGFRDHVSQIAQRVGFPEDRIVLGGDHLGPNAWTSLSAEEAMERSDVLIDQYVRAGFAKIHLDCSMSCADDPVPLPEETIAERAARLCRVAEAAYIEADTQPPVYVIGTEVPVPGGATEDLEPLQVTSPEAALGTIAMHKELFPAEAWDRVIALVVQPGVEFDHHQVLDYRPEAAQDLSRSLDDVPGMVFEAHSTDYQTQEALTALVRDHFAILKVGPGLTFALREALWALDAMERDMLGEGASDFRARVLAVMNDKPGHWKKYYHSTGSDLQLDLQYSLSDRIRYYWPDALISDAQEEMFANLRASPPPLPLISQYLPQSYAELREGTITNDPAELVMAHVMTTLDTYLKATDAGDRSNA
ncbi:D-tagatose-bisphosphate aldolase, class II, non-catalytic subunit [Erythrobacter sp. LQ02-29]|uniref:D-tagatose-bisphosphate aldolase, class II, non-catalytic subunit n=1 Tax=Erythrobacter sp. LQ02-29 TaxID=2920384 RepID=UPI001F4E63EB|nr:D-tagatose-bisphosphate aldolase, class II, non-catalytic subunit [Erythrobacter sp. LQ02-29]MCP9222614.1 D-tagatose-bisphosphate aldolase, class II, non-catalytic subunit [Erythrobacter sp. LQ02-29]